LAKDLVLTPFTIGAREVMQQVGIARDLHILSKSTGSYLDDEASSYTLERSSGTVATVSLTFYTETLPTSDIVIPAATVARTVGTSFVSPVNFATIPDTTIPLSSVSAYYSYDRTRYEFTVDALAEAVGSASNVAAGSISILVSSITGIDGVTNLTASSGGSDEEDDDDLRARIKIKRTGRDLNVVNGLSLFVRNTGFPDAYPVRVEDADSERVSGVDVFVVDRYSQTQIDTFTYYPNVEVYSFTKHPVKEVTSVVSSVTGTVGSNDYDVHIDNATPLRRSVHADDYISIRSSASLPSGSTFTVTYTYSEEITTAQDSLAIDSNEILTANPLIKRAFPLYLYVTARLTLMTNADGPSTRNNCRSALIQFIANYGLGGNLQKSDIIIVLQEGFGDFPVSTVDAVVITDYYLQDEFGNNYLPVDEVISVADTQYVVYGAATIV
jgi:hypothetical protein